MNFHRCDSHSRREYRFALAAILGALSLLVAAPATAQVFQKQNNFDSDPMWDGYENSLFDGTDVIQDFGYSSDTNFAGGAPGEVGGLIRRDRAFYADNVGALDPATTPLTMSGTASFGSAAGYQGNAIIGWFDKFGELLWESRSGIDLIGFVTDETEYIEVKFKGRNRDAAVVTNAAGQTIKEVGLIDSGTPFTYDVAWDPFGGIHGTGSLTGTFDVSVNGTVSTWTGWIDNIGDIEKDRLPLFNRYGVLALYNPASGPNTVDFFIDDISYTASPPVPDPTNYQWKLDGPGDWNVDENWDLGYAPLNTHTTVFGSTINRPSTVFTETNVTTNGVRFNSEYTYGIAGAPGTSLTLQGDASIQIDQGTPEFQLPVNLAAATTIDAAADSSITFENVFNLNGNTATKTGDGTMVLNNNASTGTGSLEVQGGTLSGAGKLSGDLTVLTGATTAPGTSAGMLKVGGNYTQNAGATLAVEIGGTLPEENFDVLAITGTASLGGTLDVALIDSYTPAINEQFTILSASSIGGSLSLGGSDGGLFNLTQVGSTLVLEFIGGTAGTTGDYNDDGTVDAADYTTWRDNLGTNNPLANDPVGGTIGQSQYTQWKDNFGNTASSSATAVPEPSAGALLGLGVLGLGVLARWGRRQFAGRALTGRSALAIIILCGSAGVVGIGTASGETYLKVETFDGDPGWTGLNNRGLYQDFGINQIPPFWIVTHLAQGANPGEIGGSFATNTPAQFPAYFADDVGSIDPRTEALTMAGKTKYYQGRGQMFYGWFDKNGTLGPFWNSDESRNYLDFMGVMTDDESFTLFAGTESRVITPRIGREPFGYLVTYNPNGGDFGQLRGSINGSPETVLDLTEEARNQLPVSFDSFGGMAVENKSADLRSAFWYYDDIVYSTSVPQDPITTIQWVSDKSLNAAAGAGWSPPFEPTSNELTGVFGPRITQPRVLFADSDITLKAVEFDSPISYGVAGQGTFNFEANTGNSSLDVLDGSHEFNIQVNVKNDIDVNVATGATLTFNEGLDLNGHTFTKTGNGDLVINNRLIYANGLITGVVIDNAVGVPEPSTLVLVSLVLLTLGSGQRRKPATATSLGAGDPSAR